MQLTSRGTLQSFIKHIWQLFSNYFPPSPAVTGSLSDPGETLTELTIAVVGGVVVVVARRRCRCLTLTADIESLKP